MKDLRDPEKLGRMLLGNAQGIRHYGDENVKLSSVYDDGARGAGWRADDVVDVGPLDRYPRS